MNRSTIRISGSGSYSIDRVVFIFLVLTIVIAAFCLGLGAFAQETKPVASGSEQPVAGTNGPAVNLMEELFGAKACQGISQMCLAGPLSLTALDEKSKATTQNIEMSFSVTNGEQYRVGLDGEYDREDWDRNIRSLSGPILQEYLQSFIPLLSTVSKQLVNSSICGGNSDINAVVGCFQFMMITNVDIGLHRAKNDTNSSPEHFAVLFLKDPTIDALSGSGTLLAFAFVSEFTKVTNIDHEFIAEKYASLYPEGKRETGPGSISIMLKQGDTIGMIIIGKSSVRKVMQNYPAVKITKVFIDVKRAQDRYSQIPGLVKSLWKKAWATELQTKEFSDIVTYHLMQAKKKMESNPEEVFQSLTAMRFFKDEISEDAYRKIGDLAVQAKAILQKKADAANAEYEVKRKKAEEMAQKSAAEKKRRNAPPERSRRLMCELTHRAIFIDQSLALEREVEEVGGVIDLTKKRSLAEAKVSLDKQIMQALTEFKKYNNRDFSYVSDCK